MQCYYTGLGVLYTCYHVIQHYCTGPDVLSIILPSLLQRTVHHLAFYSHRSLGINSSAGLLLQYISCAVCTLGVSLLSICIPLLMVRVFFNDTNTGDNNTIVYCSSEVKSPSRVTSILVNLKSKAAMR